jgi:microcin C transport system permease protein
MERLDYFLKRLLLIIPTFIGVTIACFLLIQIIPGGPVDQALIRMRGGSAIGGMETRAISAEQREQIRHNFGFDKPLLVQYKEFLWDYRLGLTRPSYKYTNRTAWELIRGRLRVSLIFGFTGFFLTYLVCIPLGIAKALRNGSTFDLVSSLAVFVGYAIPAFALGMLLKTLLCGTVDRFWDIFPVAGFTSAYYDSLPFWGKVKDIAMHMCLPILCYMIGSFAVLTLLMKNSLLEQVGQDYIRTVLAKGGTMRRAIWGHALRNALVPIATGIGGVLTIMFAGSVLIEKVFEIPGMGLLSLEAIVGRDYAVFMAILSLTTVLGLLGNVLSDLCYVLIDPRINFQ